MKKSFIKIFIACILLSLLCIPALSQVEVEPWGNITGIRIEGQLMEFETNISMVQKDWSGIKTTAKEKQRPKFHREGNQQIISSNIDSLYFTESVTDTTGGSVAVKLQLKATNDIPLEGVYYSFVVGADQFSGGSIQLDKNPPVKLSAGGPALNSYTEKPATSIRFVAAKQQLTIRFESPVDIIIKSTVESNHSLFRFYIPLKTGTIEKGQTFSKNFLISVAGTVNKEPVQVAINTKIEGRPFAGLGGNFRLQNPAVDPQVIDYCLQNLRVVWGRVEMPWRFWQPSIDTSGIDNAKAGRLNPRVQKSMEMAQRLHKMGMPVILTAWFPPAWAITGQLKFRPGQDGVWGNPLDQSKTAEIYKSIADYIQYLQDQYQVEIADFSFNESDLGINIRQTGEEHAALIKGLGAYFVSRGFKTKLLLGDNSDANTYKFIDPAMGDPATHPYIGAVSFHSWRGWDSTTLQHWADAATLLHLPLLIGEGSIDAAAWAYPAIFEEQTYALKEINLYTRLLNICQPESILQWQLTSDYSPVAGGGVYGDNSPMRPTQRFWNLKQLSSIPKNLKAMPVKCSSADISCAALGDNTSGVYSIQLVNNAAARKVTISGLPPALTKLSIYITDRTHAMEAQKSIAVKNGKAVFTLAAASYTSLLGN